MNHTVFEQLITRWQYFVTYQVPNKTLLEKTMFSTSNYNKSFIHCVAQTVVIQHAAQAVWPRQGGPGSVAQAVSWTTHYVHPEGFLLLSAFQYSPLPRQICLGFSLPVFPSPSVRSVWDSASLYSLLPLSDLSGIQPPFIPFSLCQICLGFSLPVFPSPPSSVWDSASLYSLLLTVGKITPCLVRDA